MKLQSIASGSSGNCIYVETKKNRILVDAGHSGRQIEMYMKMANLNIKDIDALFVTHEHGDHIKGVGVLSRRYHIPVFANKGTWNAIGRRCGKITEANRQVFKTGEAFSFHGTKVVPFRIHHDAKDPVGFTFEDETGKIALLTDTGFVDERMMDTIKDSDIYYLEANHDVDMLLEGPYPELLKQRILSELGHLSNLQCADVLTEIFNGFEKVYLAHMSAENNDTTLCLETVRNVLFNRGFAGLDGISVAPRFSPSELGVCREGALYCEN